MDRHELILKWAEAAVDENVALKAEVARLKEENECLKEQNKHARTYADSLEKSLAVRRGADDPRKPRPACETALSALDLVRNWDRDECVTDLRKQRVELHRRIDALKAGRELKMGDVMAALGEDIEHPRGTLLFVLDNLREQLRMIFASDTELDMTHEEWFQPPLSLFRHADEDVEADMSDDDDNSENSESMEEEL
jgi:hypothetical protein